MQPEWIGIWPRLVMTKFVHCLPYRGEFVNLAAIVSVLQVLDNRRPILERFVVVVEVVKYFILHVL